MIGGATFSADRLYRYALTRELSPDEDSDKRAVFVMLNPSTADEFTNDPTIRRCIGFATTWCYWHLTIVNLFAYRSTDPKALAHVADPIGPGNDQRILDAVERAQLVIAAWGADPMAIERGRVVRALLDRAGIALHHLGLTKAGHPKHPLYLPGKTLPVEWQPENSIARSEAATPPPAAAPAVEAGR